ncbi:MAG: 3-phosphoshikimate 1-carboxyvinyltransferase [Eubacterium sp.]|nr:3-phosphoshikimate 1-carboxyvinyltransferase [Eubacterium sp.]
MDTRSITIKYSNAPHATVRTIASKSHAHRLLIAAALSDKPSKIMTPDTSKDIEATINSLNGLGARIVRHAEYIEVNPIELFAPISDIANIETGSPAENAPGLSKIDCGESGSTLRFILPVIGALGKTAEITMHGRLSERPLSPMYEELISHGLKMSSQGSNPFSISGQLTGGDYTIAGNISSQFITGLLFALPLINPGASSASDNSGSNSSGILHVTGKLESRPYVDITLDVLNEFGINIKEETLENGDTLFTIPSGQTYHSEEALTVDGDWSNAAFFLAAGALLEKGVTVTGLNIDSLQGDKKILDILKSFGAEVSISPSAASSGILSEVTVSDITVKRTGRLQGTEIDAADIPDLVPIISVVASLSEGRTTIRNIERLKIKESDRVKTVISTLSTLGAKIFEEDNSIVIDGVPALSGGTVDSFNDHRIAMSAAIASIGCTGPVTITNPMAVEKSYPDFYNVLKDTLCEVTLGE